MTQGWMSEPGAYDRVRERTLIGRVGQPDDVANWVVFLASDVPGTPSASRSTCPADS